MFQASEHIAHSGNSESVRIVGIPLLETHRPCFEQKPEILKKTKGSKYSEAKVLFSLLLVQNTELADHVSAKRGVLSHANMKARLRPM